MKLKLLKTSAVIALLSLSATGYAASKGSIILKTGSFSLSTSNQTILTPLSFDTSSSGVFAIEYEARLKKNTSWGVEFITYNNDYTGGSGGSSNARQLTGNFRQYFDAGKNVKPFIGAGISAASATMSGQVVGSVGGIGFQAMGGVKFPFSKKAFAIVEYKIISSAPDDAAGVSVDTSGNGLFAGIGFKF